MLLKKETEHIFTVHYFKYNVFLSQGERLKVDTVVVWHNPEVLSFQHI